LEVAVSDTQLDSVIEAITHTAHTGKIGDGKIFITELLQIIRIYANESGHAAL